MKLLKRLCPLLLLLLMPWKGDPLPGSTLVCPLRPNPGPQGVQEVRTLQQWLWNVLLVA